MLRLVIWPIENQRTTWKASLQIFTFHLLEFHTLKSPYLTQVSLTGSSEETTAFVTEVSTLEPDLSVSARGVGPQTTATRRESQLWRKISRFVSSSHPSPMKTKMTTRRITMNSRITLNTWRRTLSTSTLMTAHRQQKNRASTSFKLRVKTTRRVFWQLYWILPLHTV